MGHLYFALYHHYDQLVIDQKSISPWTHLDFCFFVKKTTLLKNISLTQRQRDRSTVLYYISHVLLSPADIP